MHLLTFHPHNTWPLEMHAFLLNLIKLSYLHYSYINKPHMFFFFHVLAAIQDGGKTKLGLNNATSTDYAALDRFQSRVGSIVRPSGGSFLSNRSLQQQPCESCRPKVSISVLVRLLVILYVMWNISYLCACFS